MKLGIITSGGDAPGMNPCLAQIVREGQKRGHEIIGFEGGFRGIAEDKYRRLLSEEVALWYQRGGTCIKTGRFPELEKETVQKKIAKQLAAHGIEGLMVLGGDGSFKGALAVHRMLPELNMIGIPCTIDNNVYGSDYTLGFDTALNTQTTYMDGLMDTGESLDGRVFFIETLGAYDGYLAQSTYLMGMAEFAVLDEVPMKEEEIIQRVLQAREEKKSGSIYVMFSESDGKHRCLRIADVIRDRYNVNIKCSILGFSQRGNAPTARDRLMASGFADRAIRAMETGVKNQYIVYRKGEFQYMDLSNASKKKVFDWHHI